MRFCHADHLLHTVYENIDNKPDIVGVLPDSKPTQAELPEEDVATEQCTGIQNTDVAVPLQRSAWEIHAPHRLIEEL